MDCIRQGYVSTLWLSILARLFAKGMEPNERGINEFLDQAHTTLAGENIALKHAAFNCVLSFL